MPSQLPQPTIAQLVAAGTAALTGERDIYADPRSGALYDHAKGPFAILCSRESDRDQDQFRDIYFASSDGPALTRLVQQRFASYGVVRVRDSAGLGTCAFVRPAATGGEGTFLQGTRVQVPGTPPAVYQVAEDTTVSAAALSVTIPVEATVLGSGSAASASSGLLLLDPIYDNTWTPAQLVCAAGTDFEPAAAFRARALAVQAAGRQGYLPNLVAACQSAGAAYVLAFPSSYGLAVDDYADDYGLNSIYVADANYQSSPALINACAVALEPWRVGGADLWVGGIVSTPVSISMLVALTDAPERLPLVTIRRACLQALLGVFGPTSGGFTYAAGALTGAVAGASPYVQLAGLPTTWAPETAYAVGALVVPSPSNGQVYQCSAAGETGLDEPAFPLVVGRAVPDGSLVWTCLSVPGLGVYVGGAIRTTDPVLAQGIFPASLPRYTLAQAAVALSFVGPL